MERRINDLETLNKEFITELQSMRIKQEAQNELYELKNYINSTNDDMDTQNDIVNELKVRHLFLSSPSACGRAELLTTEICSVRLFPIFFCFCRASKLF